jgi:uncharacterized CHY-type Zn-finger protein
MSECPRCSANLTVNDFRCPRCHFQVVDACPSCRREVPIDAYQSVVPDLWTCPKCQSRLRARYADPMITDQGDFVEPLVRLTLATAERAA